ncbi:MAG: hypothetical protein KJP22_03125 [Acidimicrobiia bacterium]|nr:hypothetical protein [Acidimicrobiia bacterium]NNJ48241.1 hypothetical protein [Acidimicrobiia bacterium]NNL12404.1 hypothetical protein [Acidimicrobiia bacterium]
MRARSCVPASRLGDQQRSQPDIVKALMQTRYLIIASLITALVILIAGAWWFYARAI